MNNKAILTIVAVLAIAVIAFWFMNVRGIRKASVVSPTPTETQKVEPTAKEDKMTKDEVKTITLDVSNFKYSLKEIKVKKGEKVKVVLNVKEGMHDFVIDEFDAKTKRGNANDSVDTEFTADKTGSFEYYCSVGQHRSMGMVGKLIVE